MSVLHGRLQAPLVYSDYCLHGKDSAQALSTAYEILNLPSIMEDQARHFPFLPDAFFTLSLALTQAAMAFCTPKDTALLPWKLP